MKNNDDSCLCLFSLQGDRNFSDYDVIRLTVKLSRSLLL